METEVFFQFEIIINVLAILIHLYTYVKGLWPIKYFNFVSAGAFFIRQNLTSTDVRKMVPVLKGLNGQAHHLASVMVVTNSNVGSRYMSR